MLVGNVAITLNLLSIAVLTFAISVALVAVISLFTLPRLVQLTFGIRKLFLWALVTAPWWVVISCIAFLWPRQQDVFPSVWLNELAHWHHIDIFSFTSWHAITLFSAFAYLLWSITKTVHIRKKQSSAMASLISLSDIDPKAIIGKQGYYSLPMTIPTAFTSGLLNPKIYVTSALIAKVSEQELDIIVRHEMAHVDARDPMFKVVFATFAAFFPSTVTGNLVKQFTLLTEQLADSAATKEYDNLDVAQTLINVARIQRSGDSIATSLSCDGLQTSYFGNDQTSLRVQGLISPMVPSSRLAIRLAFILVAFTPLLAASTVDSLHHFIETFFTH